jgi:hypothetical protein
LVTVKVLSKRSIFLPSLILDPVSKGIATAATGDHPEVVPPSPALGVQAAKAKATIEERSTSRPRLPCLVFGLPEPVAKGYLDVE